MSITLKKRQHTPNLLFCAAHLKFLPQFLITILSIWLDRDVKVFTFLLGQQLKPKTQNKNRAMSEKIQDYYQTVTTSISTLNIPSRFPLSLSFLSTTSLLPILTSYHPSTPCFCSSEIPKERDPMKSFLLVKSQSQTSTDRRRSLSLSFRLL